MCAGRARGFSARLGRDGGQGEVEHGIAWQGVAMLRPLKKPGVPQRYLTYDLEWYPETYEVRLVGCYDGARYRSYPSVAEFLENELTEENAGHTFFAHAGGLADVQFVFEELLKSRASFTLSAAFSGSSAIIVRVNFKGVEFAFCDSYWLMRDRLAKIGESLGNKKGGEDYHCPHDCGHDDGMCIFYAPMGILRDYNEKDVRILYDGISRLEEELLELGGELKMTIASCAMRLFRGRFLRREIRTSTKLNLIAREAYIASRVEVFRRKLVGPAHYYDINSSFPYSMKFSVPGSLIGTNARWDPSDELALVRADVEVFPCDVPPIPYRTKENRVYFPVGRWTGWFFGTDLAFLLEAGGRIHKVHKAYHFEGFQDMADYVETIYELRRSSKDKFRKLVYKYLLNSLYGKTGEASIKDVLTIGLPLPKGAIDPVEMYGGAWYYAKESMIAHAHVPIAGTITSRSRCALTRFLWESKAPYYCDTDSVPTTNLTMPTGDALGQLKLEALGEGTSQESTTIAWGEFVNPKLYALGNDRGYVHVKAKGFSPVKGRKLTLEDWERIKVSGDQDEDGDFINPGHPVRRMLRVREVFSEAHIAAKQDQPVDLHPREKHFEKRLRLGANRSKRRWCADGDRTEPWTVEELERPWKAERRTA